MRYENKASTIGWADVFLTHLAKWPLPRPNEAGKKLFIHSVPQLLTLGHIMDFSFSQFSPFFKMIWKEMIPHLKALK